MKAHILANTDETYSEAELDAMSIEALEKLVKVIGVPEQDSRSFYLGRMGGTSLISQESVEEPLLPTEVYEAQRIAANKTTAQAEK